jgi:alkyl sulfatase BDS1-like metallo-beta-lactamase superfamily hydrolase
MAAFLSPAWIEELDRAGVPVDPALAFSLEQVVTEAPGGDVRYRVTLAGGRLRVRAANDEAAPADATLTTSYRTAVELATGRRDASDAFAAGLVRFHGNLTLVQTATAALTAAAEVLASVRNRTTFPPPVAAAP